MALRLENRIHELQKPVGLRSSLRHLLHTYQKPFKTGSLYLELAHPHPLLRIKKSVGLKPSSVHPQHTCRRPLKLAHPILSYKRSICHNRDTKFGPWNGVLPENGEEHFFFQRLNDSLILISFSPYRLQIWGFITLFSIKLSLTMTVSAFSGSIFVAKT